VTGDGWTFKTCRFAQAEEEPQGPFYWDDRFASGLSALFQRSVFPLESSTGRPKTEP